MKFKKKLYRHKTLILLGDIGIEKLLVSNKISLGEKNYKYFIGYSYNDIKVRPLNIMLPKTSAYVKSYDEQTKWMYFFWLKMMIYYKNIILFGIKFALI